MSYRIGVDIGGTFTDFALFDDITGEVRTHKQLTTPRNPSQAVIEGAQNIVNKAGLSFDQISTVVHGTTLVTNAIIERNQTPVAMLVTKGFKDLLDIGYERRYDLFDLRLDFPKPAVPRSLRLEVPGRIDYEGIEVDQLELDSIFEPLSKLCKEHSLKAISVCFLHSTRNSSHEDKTREWLNKRFPNLTVTLSSEVFPYPREYDRWTTACLNAYVQPITNEYLTNLESGLESLGFKGKFLIMSSSGGTLIPDIARKFPIRLLESGPAAGALMSANIGNKKNIGRILSFDMGGTTAKGCLIRDGQPLKRYDFEVARVHEFRKGSGLLTRIPVIDMIEIGSGGGSLADINDRGILRVGPLSASSEPGPACYGLGGTRPTLTDANVLLGYLDPDAFLGGRMSLDLEAAKSAVHNKVADNLKINDIQAAWGIHEVINEDIARAFREHAAERGFDYQHSSMVVFGGSGPLHGCRVARKLHIPKVLYPWGAGVMSAFGLLFSPLAFEVLNARRYSLDKIQPDQLVSELEVTGNLAASFLRQSGADQESIKIQYRLDMHYEGQGYEVEVALPYDMPTDKALSSLPSLFEKAYKNIFGITLDDRVLEIISWKAEAIGPVPGKDTQYKLIDIGVDRPLIKKQINAYFPEADGFVECPVYDRYALPHGFEFEGPALIQENESTCVINPGDVARVDDEMNIEIDIGV